MQPEPIFDLAHLGHLELLTPKPDESLKFFVDVMGMTISGRQGESVYLRGWDDYERYSLKLTASKTSGMEHMALRARSPQALERRVAALKGSGFDIGWTDGDLEDKYVTARYRVLMSKDQYDRMMAYVRDLQGRSHTWSAELYNCNAFVADIAHQMGLKAPASTLIYPKIFINHLRMMNTSNPNADETLVSDNVKEMSSPTRDGRAMIVSGVHTIRPDGTPVTDVAAATPPKPSVTPKVSVGAVRVSSKTTSPDAASVPSH